VVSICCSDSNKATLGESLFDIILALIALGILVTVHEAGHFIAARLCGVKVEVFSIGFGKPIFKIVRSEIEYRIGWIPLGGYVKMKGEALEEDATEEPDSFQFTKWWKKAIIALAGPISNLLFAVVIFILTFMLPGKVEDQRPVIGKSTGEYSLLFTPGDSILAVNDKPVMGWYQFLGELHKDGQNGISLVRDGKKLTLTIPAVNLETLSTEVLPAVPSIIGEVSPGLPAWRAGLKTGDKIISVDTVQINNWYEMRAQISKAATDTVLLKIQRGKEVLNRAMPLEKNPLIDGQRVIGITQLMPVSYTQSYPPGTAIKYGVTSTLNFIAYNYIGLYKVFSKPETIKNSLGGPVMIYSLSSQSAHKGWSSWIMFIAAISLVLMIMNLLPIPVLDGGHIMFALIQAVRGKPLPRKTQIVLQNIGGVLLLMLMFYAFYNDFTKVFTRAISTMGKP
jgi:regulator of sigma E protease